MAEPDKVRIEITRDYWEISVLDEVGKLMKRRRMQREGHGSGCFRGTTPGHFGKDVELGNVGPVLEDMPHFMDVANALRDV